MRKIETLEQKERKEKKKQRVLGGILILVLTMSIAGYAAFSGTDQNSNGKRTYNGLDFVYDNGFWRTSINEKNLVFYNLPYDLNEINISLNASIDDYYNKPLYLVGAYPSMIAYDLNGLVLRMQGACVPGVDCLDENLPVKNCSEDNVLIFIEGNESRIYQNENCVYLEGDLQKTSDKYIYNLLNIQ